MKNPRGRDFATRGLRRLGEAVAAGDVFVHSPPRLSNRRSPPRSSRSSHRRASAATGESWCPCPRCFLALPLLLLACPPRQRKHWTEAKIDETVERQYAALIDRLAALQPTDDDKGRAVPSGFAIDSRRQSRLGNVLQAHAAEQASLTGDLAAAWSKLEETAARLALIIHCVKAAQAVPPAKPWLSDAAALQPANEVDGDSMRAAIRLTEWFKHETQRVYAVLGTAR